MKIGPILATGALMMITVSLHAQKVVIDSLDSTGRLTATVPSNSVYSVEWIGALDSANGWQQGWSHLRDQKSEDGQVDVEVPMAFRLTAWTNGVFLNAPIGRTYHYKVTNSAISNNVWRQEIRVMGDIQIPHVNKTYRMISVEEFYDHADNPPIGAQSRHTALIRSDENNSYTYDPYDLADVNDWKDGSGVTTWTYFSSAVETTNEATVVGLTNIVIGTTTYADCVEIYTEGEDNGFAWQEAFPFRYYTEWIKPGGFLVRKENYWLYYPDAASAPEIFAASPVVYELQGWTDE